MYWDKLIEDMSGDIRRLDHVIRFSSIPVSVPESTATHSFWVAIYSAMIHRNVAPAHEREILGSILLHALAHDLAECVTGDVVRVFKYSTPELKEEIDRAEGILSQGLPIQVRSMMDGMAEIGELGTELASYVKDVVKCADFLSLLQYMRREILRGNREIRPYFERMIRDLEAASESKSVHLVRGNEFRPGGLYTAMKVQASNLFHPGSV